MKDFADRKQLEKHQNKIKHWKNSLTNYKQWTEKGNKHKLIINDIYRSETCTGCVCLSIELFQLSHNKNCVTDFKNRFQINLRKQLKLPLLSVY